jgi:hypothetical protein
LPAHLRPITADIPAAWSPEQALAVFELLDDLRDKIWTHYGSQMQRLLQQLQTPAACDADDGGGDDPSF